MQITNQIGSKYHSTRGITEEGFTIVDFVSLENNRANLLTKNLSSDLFGKHAVIVDKIIEATKILHALHWDRRLSYQG
jgi:hypothetical protein